MFGIPHRREKIDALNYEYEGNDSGNNSGILVWDWSVTESERDDDEADEADDKADNDEGSGED